MVLSLTNENRPTTAVFREHKRTDQFYLNIRRDSIFIENSFFSKMVSIWNTLAKNLKTEPQSYQTIKAKMKMLFLEKFKNEINLPEYNKKCWKDLKFH